MSILSFQRRDDFLNYGTPYLRRVRGETWRTHSCVPRRDSSRRLCLDGSIGQQAPREVSARHARVRAPRLRRWAAPGGPTAHGGQDWRRYTLRYNYKFMAQLFRVAAITDEFYPDVEN